MIIILNKDMAFYNNKNIDNNRKFYEFIIYESYLYTIYKPEDNYEDIACDMCNSIDINSDYTTSIIKMNSHKFYTAVKHNIPDKLIITNEHINLLFKKDNIQILDLILLENIDNCKNLLFTKFIKYEMYNELIILLDMDCIDVNILKETIYDNEIFFKNPKITLLLIKYTKMDETIMYHIIDYLTFCYNLFKSYDKHMVEFNSNQRQYDTKYEYTRYEIDKTTIKLEHEQIVYIYYIEILDRIYNNTNCLKLFLKTFVNNFYYIRNINFINNCLYYFNNIDVLPVFNAIDKLSKYCKNQIKPILLLSVHTIITYKPLKKVLTKYYNNKNDFILSIILENKLMINLVARMYKIYKRRQIFPLSYYKIANDSNLRTVLKNYLK